MTTRLLLAFLTAALHAQDPLVSWMNAIAQRQLSERDRAVAAIQTVDAARARQRRVREIVLSSIGGLPDYTGPLNSRITGRIDAGGYVIEKVLFESLERYYVSANVYRPARAGRHSAILFQSGHTQQGKPEPQHSAANLALQ